MRTPKALREPETRQALIVAVGVWAATVPIFMAPSLAAPRPAPAWSWMAMGLVALIGIAFTPCLLWVVRATERSLVRRFRIPIIIVAVVTAALIHSGLDAALHDALRYWFSPSSRGTMFVNEQGKPTPAPLHYYVLMNFIILLWVHAGVTALGALTRFNWVVRRQEVAIVEARAAADQARLATIRLQLSPHFLFNTLNAISSLILTGRHADAEAMLARLSDFLRASLSAKEAEHVSVASELSAVGAYLDIESLRYDGQLAVEIVSDERLHDAMVPTFLLQPLAEQAVAHAVSPPKRAMIICVAASRDGTDGLVITVRARAEFDKLSLSPPVLDLTPVSTRLTAVYGEQARIDGSSDAAGFVAVARLPLRRGAAERDV